MAGQQYVITKIKCLKQSPLAIYIYDIYTIYDSWPKPIGLEGMDPVGTSIILSSVSRTPGAERSCTVL